MAAKKHFKNLSGGRKFWVMTMGAAQVALQGAALKDLAGRPAAQVNGPKIAWFFASFFNFIGPLSYFAVGRKK